jgi:uncharacterized membrane protein
MYATTIRYCWSNSAIRSCLGRTTIHDCFEQGQRPVRYNKARKRIDAPFCAGNPKLKELVSRAREFIMADLNRADMNQSDGVIAPGLSDNAAAGIAYITIVPAVVLLIVDPYRRSSFVRFHCWQSIFFFIAWAVVNILVGVAQNLAPAVVFQAMAPWQIVGLIFFVVWLVVFINAFNGKRMKLPIVGDMAERQANR